MNDLNDPKTDHELRRHFSGLQFAAVDALHVWCSCEQLITTLEADFKDPEAATVWGQLPDHLLSVLDALAYITDTQDGTISMPWWAWRNTLSEQINRLSTQVAMLRVGPISS